jgi:hypothetical protein
MKYLRLIARYVLTLPVVLLTCVFLAMSVVLINWTDRK